VARHVVPYHLEVYPLDESSSYSIERPAKLPKNAYRRCRASLRAKRGNLASTFNQERCDCFVAFCSSQWRCYLWFSRGLSPSSSIKSVPPTSV